MRHAYDKRCATYKHFSTSAGDRNAGARVTDLGVMAAEAVGLDSAVSGYRRWE
jgi:hypothetical protein